MLGPLCVKSPLHQVLQQSMITKRPRGKTFLRQYDWYLEVLFLLLSLSKIAIHSRNNSSCIWEDLQFIHLHPRASMNFLLSVTKNMCCPHKTATPPSSYLRACASGREAESPHIHRHTHTHKYLYTCTYTQICTHTQICIYTCTHTYVYTRTHTHTHTPRAFYPQHTWEV